jgi:drug/metabolite transporter (DMT)-like permease
MIYAFFPVFAAMLYGLAYAMADRAFKVTNITTYMLISYMFGLIMFLGVWKFKNEQISFSFLNNKYDALIVLASVSAPSLGWLFTMFAIQKTSASYAAFAEISYPLFTLLFLFLIFGIRHFDFSILVGGALVILGSAVLVSGQLKHS